MNSRHSPIMRALKPFALIAVTLMASSCKAPPDTRAYLDKGLNAYLTCLPQDAAMTAAHRGTHRGSAYPENSLSALEALMDRGILIAEIDVARTRDGVHILYHDGVWEEGSNGSGAVAATTLETVGTISLRDTNGRLRDDGVPTLADYLAAAKGKLFLEIDFKSSANYGAVIDQITEAGMINDVILIAYNKGQARKLRQLAPTAYISIPDGQGDGIAPPTLTWLGGDTRRVDGPTIGKLRGDRFDPNGRNQIEALNIAVTDYPLAEAPIIGLRGRAATDFTACLVAN